MNLFYRNNEALDSICPVNVASVTVGLLLKIFIFFNENITPGTLEDVLNRRQVGDGKE
jgi:hypothetical protein